MRPLLIALLMSGCLIGTGEITGTGGDDGTGEGGGGGGGGGGDGTGSGGGGGTMPRLEATIDKAAVATQLGKTETLVVTLTSVNGYTGTVTVAPSMMDGTTPLTGYTLTPTPASVDIGADATATVMVAVKVPTDAAVLAPSLKIDLGTANVISAFTVANQLEIDFTAGLGTGHRIRRCLRPTHRFGSGAGRW